jgi:hypothetical protein
MTDVEDVAARIFEAADGVVHPWELARLNGYEVRVGPPRLPAMLLGRTIIVPRHRTERRAFSVMHELAHALLRSIGEPDDERLVDEVACASLMPRPSMLAVVRDHGVDLRALKEAHPFASHEALARRVKQLELGSAVVHDVGPRGRITKRIGAFTLDPHARTLLRIARNDNVDVADRGVRAYQVRDGAWSRVIVIRETSGALRRAAASPR